MHADLEKDIADPAAADRQERTQQKMDRRIGDLQLVLIRDILEDDPGPPVKSHRHDIGYHPILLGLQ